MPDAAEVLVGLATDLEQADGPPTAPQRAAADEYGRHVDTALLRWNAWRREQAAQLQRLGEREASKP